MREYVIITDTSSNLTNEIIDRYGIEIVPLIFVSEGKEYLSYEKNADNDLSAFYDMLRHKKRFTTTSVNQAQFCNAFEGALKEGKDVLYLGFSSALSGTYAAAINAKSILEKEYPERKIVTVDTLGASLGQGLMVIKAAEMKQSGMSIDEVGNWVENNKLHICHFFTVDNLEYLFLGGRVSKSAYLIANMVNIKPIMHMDDNGKLVATGKVIGRRKSIQTIADMVVKNIINPESQTVCISHGDCIADVENLKAKIEAKIKVKEWVVNYVDPVVGIHSGPGTIAIFFIGDKR
ncbi:MAG: DegV family protein [Clostridia bacterium]|nr:DegV family protein [Clostridia bacterium]